MRTRLNRERLNDLGTDELIGHCYRMMGLSQDDEQMLKFLSALVLYVERYFTDKILIEVIVRRGFSKISHRSDVVEDMIRDLTFSAKVNVLENLDEKKYRPVISYLRCLNGIRNQIFHANFSSIKYKGKLIRLVGTQRDIIFDFSEALSKCLT